MPGNFVEYLKDKDVFGQSVTVSYKGSDQLKTIVGSFATIATYILILFNALTLFTNFMNSELAQTSTSTVQFDRFPERGFNFDDNSFHVSVVMEPAMPENIGQVSVYLASEWCQEPAFKCVQQGKYTKVPLIDCTEEKYEFFHSYWNERGLEISLEKIHEGVRCINDTQLEIQGIKELRTGFAEVRIELEHCVTTASDLSECADAETTNAFWQQHNDMLVQYDFMQVNLNNIT